MWVSKKISLSPKSRGFHLVTDELLNQLPEIHDYKIGSALFMIMHTSASLCINENADPSVRKDMKNWLDRNVKENEPYYIHTYEGPDDMPAHIKSVLFGINVTIPVLNGKLDLGTWQGIYLGEHRDRGGSRTVSVTLQGETF